MPLSSIRDEAEPNLSVARFFAPALPDSAHDKTLDDIPSLNNILSSHPKDQPDQPDQPDHYNDVNIRPRPEANVRPQPKANVRPRPEALLSFSSDDEGDDGGLGADHSLPSSRFEVDDDGGFGDEEEEVDVAVDAYSWKIDHSNGHHRLRG